MRTRQLKLFFTLILSLCGIIAILFLCKKQYRITYVKATTAFQKAIEKEKEIRLSNIKMHTFFHTGTNPQPISRKEKEEWADQSFLMDKDSCRFFLDSIFRAELSLIGLTSRTAVRCFKGEREHCCCKDTVFLKQAIVLEPVVYKRKENTNDTITLYAYIQTSWDQILSRVWFKILLICLATGLAIALVHIFIYLCVKKNKVITIEKVIEKERVTLVRSFGRKGALPYGIHFDKKTGILTQGSESIKLTGQKLNLFILLLESRKTIVNHTTLYTQGMKHKLNPDLTEEQIIENISNAITRLRKELKTIPSIQIKSFRKKGYQLIFNEEEGAISVDINR